MKLISARLIMATLLLCGVQACANKGKLKSPSQIAAQQAKQEKRAQHASSNNELDDEDSKPAQSTPVLADPAAHIPPAGSAQDNIVPDIVANPPVPTRNVDSDAEVNPPITPLSPMGAK